MLEHIKSSTPVMITKTDWSKWKLMKISFTTYPDTICSWLWFCWNLDIFVGWFPVLKFFVLLSYLVSHVL